MANHASHGSLPYVVKGARFTIQIPYLDGTGTPTDPTTPDTEFSLDDSAPADTAEEVSAYRNSVAMLTLSGAETNGSLLSVAAKSASGPKTTILTAHPRVLPVLFSGTATAGAAGTITLPTSVPRLLPNCLLGCIIKTTGGTGGGGTGGANNQARVVTGFTSSGVASVSPNWEVTPDNTTTFEVLLTPEAHLAWPLIAPGEVSAVPGYADFIGVWFSYMFALSRNKITQTGSTFALRNDADSGNIGTGAVSDDGTTFVAGEIG